MLYFYLSCFVVGLLLAVRLMFFGAERKQLIAGQRVPLRWTEPLSVSLLVTFGVSGYALTRVSAFFTAAVFLFACILALTCGWAVTRLAIATARIQPDHDPDDPRYVMQGHVGVVVATIASGAVGEISFGSDGSPSTIPARSLTNDTLEVGEDVCIERIEDGVAYVERWTLVEQRL